MSKTLNTQTIDIVALILSRDATFV